MASLRIWALGQCSDEFLLEGYDILGGWLSERFPLRQEGLYLDEVPGASSHVFPVVLVDSRLQ